MFNCIFNNASTRAQPIAHQSPSCTLLFKRVLLVFSFYRISSPCSSSVGVGYTIFTSSQSTNSLQFICEYLHLHHLQYQLYRNTLLPHHKYYGNTNIKTNIIGYIFTNFKQKIGIIRFCCNHNHHIFINLQGIISLFNKHVL